MDWPQTSKHARKFLRSMGEWKTSSGKSGEGWLEFWGEYEGPTFCEQLDTVGLMPRYVQEPDQNFGKPGLNTDPWVFHPGFVWSVCRHNRVKENTCSGDIVLFGSSIRGDWYLDTVMVVEERRNSGKGVIGGTYDDIIFAEIEHTYRPFIGKRFRSMSEPFSFVPASLVNEGHMPFERVRITDLLSKLKKQSGGSPPSPKNCQALVYCWSEKGVAGFWQDIVQTVEGAGLVLGVSIEHPCSH